MIDVIGTDAGAPASLPTALQQLIREAHWIAAPRRLQPALKAWLNQPKPLIDSDDPRLLVERELLPRPRKAYVFPTRARHM